MARVTTGVMQKLRDELPRLKAMRDDGMTYPQMDATLTKEWGMRVRDGNIHQVLREAGYSKKRAPCLPMNGRRVIEVSDNRLRLMIRKRSVCLTQDGQKYELRPIGACCKRNKEYFVGRRKAMLKDLKFCPFCQEEIVKDI